jgi:hypothetical protein
MIRMFVLLAFSFIFTATIDATLFVQAIVLTMVGLYFLLFELRIEYSLLDIELSFKTENKYLTYLFSIVIILLNYFLIYLLLHEFYLVFAVIFFIECSLKILVDTNIEDLITNKKITFKGDGNEIEI